MSQKQKSKTGVLIVIALIISLIVWISFTFFKAYQPKEIILQGQIDAQSYNVSSKIPGRISEVFVKKGDNIQVGKKIFSMSSPELNTKLLQAQAAKDVAVAQKNQANNGARKQEIRAALSQLHKAQAAEKLMHKTYQRVDKLFKSGVVSEQKRDEVFTQYKAAKFTTSGAYELYLMAKEGARVEIKDAALAQEKIYNAKVDEVNVYLKESIQYAFHKGEVTQILIHSGELSPSGFPVVSLVDIEDSWAKFSIREDYLPHFTVGKIFEAKIPALGDKTYKFKVSFISVMGDFATWRATESGKGFDMKSFEVELRALKPIENLRVGMSVLLTL